MKLVGIFTWLAPLICFASAISTQEQSIGLNATEILALVQTTGDLKFVPFVPQVENQANLSISLAVPPSALSHLSSGNLIVYVMMKPKRPDSQLYFARNPAAKAYYLTLSCAVSNGSCGSGSVTSRHVEIFFNAPTEASLAGDEVIVRAGLSPFLAEQAVNTGEFFLDQDAYDQVVQLEARVSNASISQETSFVPVQSGRPIVQASGSVVVTNVQNSISAPVKEITASVQSERPVQPSDKTLAFVGGFDENQSATSAGFSGIAVSNSTMVSKEIGPEGIPVESFHPVASSSGLSILRVEPTISNFIILVVVFLAALNITRHIPFGKSG